jgi:hypothetical protein
MPQSAWLDSDTPLSEIPHKQALFPGRPGPGCCQAAGVPDGRRWQRPSTYNLKWYTLADVRRPVCRPDGRRMRIERPGSLKLESVNLLGLESRTI